MIELWQTEWCLSSRRVRERLTELGVDYVIRQVPVERDERVLLEQATGMRSIPALVLESGEAIVGEDSIRTYLDDRYPEPPQAAEHRAKAVKANRRFLQEECR